MWSLLDQTEKQGKEEITVKVRRLKGGVNRKRVDGKVVKQTFRHSNLMLKALVGFEGNTLPNSLPAEIIFSQMWVSKQDGKKWQGGSVKTRCPKTGKMIEVKVKPDTRFYYLRDSINVKRVCIRDYKEQKVSKRCVSKVTQRVPVDQDTTGATCLKSTCPETGETIERWVIKHTIAQKSFEVNTSEYKSQYKLALQYIAKEFGLDVAKEYATHLLARKSED